MNSVLDMNLVKNWIIKLVLLPGIRVTVGGIAATTKLVSVLEKKKR